MRLSISKNSAACAVCTAVAARVFCWLMVDKPALHNGAWLSALIGGLLAIPLLLCLQTLARGENHRAKSLLFFALAMFNLLGAADALADIVRSAGYLALDRTPQYALTLPVCLALLWCVSRNGDAIGYGAMVWMRLFPVLMLVVVLLQLRYYRPEWLLPVLGNGWPQTINGSVEIAGWIASAAGIFLAANDKGKKKISLLKLCLIGLGVAVLLILLRLMMTPAILSATRSTWLLRLDSLLTNGRAPLYLQLPMIVIWYAGLLHLLACNAFAAAALFQRVMPKLNGRLWALAVVAATGLLASRVFQLESQIQLIVQWQFIVLAAIAALTCAISARQKGGMKTCEGSC